MAGKKIPICPETGKKLFTDKQKINMANTAKRWQDPAYRAKQSESRKNRWSDPVSGPKMRDAAARRIAEFNKTQKAKDARSISSAANWKDSKTRAKMLSGMVARKAEIFKETSPNNFESRCYLFLDECGMQYEKQYPILAAHTIADAYFPALNLCVYFDSEYWHSMPANKERDDRQRAALQTMGYLVMLIRCDRWAREINQHDLDALRAALCPD